MPIKVLNNVYLLQDPERRYAYGHEYMSSMYDPVDEESVRKEALEQSKEKWMTPKGFVYPGFKSSIESNIHPYKPDETRMIELREVTELSILYHFLISLKVAFYSPNYPEIKMKLRATALLLDTL